ncbi:purple acid phosphatase [Elysia marginata]|uniref:Purple acid phosphatase n=1 Tax=Elysia marginata TaxID=1093978 RepID=A0AAV4FV75_9GAST|nr:purple acid phosphatase [Elysia marginata]
MYIECDFAYDLSKDQGRVGDTFMEQIEPLAATLPYMTCNGNHENYYNFSNYKARFNMPNDNKKMYYSFNVGPIHFVSMSTEFMYFPNYGFQQIFDHYEFVKNDLIVSELVRGGTRSRSRLTRILIFFCNRKN